MAWRNAPIIHLAPIAAEVDLQLLSHFSNSFLGLTPQGWLRNWDSKGRVSLRNWDLLQDRLPLASAVVVSMEDLAGDPAQAQAMASVCRLLVVTEAARGAWVYFQGETKRIPAPVIDTVIDSTGAGDIFSAAFFIKLSQGCDPWQSVVFANSLAARSVTRAGLNGTPQPDEIVGLQ